MNTIETAFNAFIDAAILDPAISRADAGDIIESFGPTLSNANARGWLDDLAVEYNALGIINNNTYTSLRNSSVNDGAVASKNLFDALIARVNSLPRSMLVNAAIDEESATQALASIAANIAIIEGNKTGGVNVQLDTAYDQAIAALRQLQIELQQQQGI